MKSSLQYLYWNNSGDHIAFEKEQQVIVFGPEWLRVSYHWSGEISLPIGMIRRTFHIISNRISLALLRTVRVEDAWVRFEHDVPTELYGEGAHHDFSWYLEGDSETRVSSVEEIISWLSECSYAEDPELFHEGDYWQHPCTFEKLRTGDCEDYALWIWRKLLRLGFEAEFVAGRCLTYRDGEAKSNWNSGHAWVQFVQNGSRYVFDALPANGEAVIRPIEDVRSLYLPEVSVDDSLRRWVYGGYYLLRKGKAGP